MGNAFAGNGLEYEFYINNELVSSGSGPRVLNKTVSYTFPSAATYTLKLTVTDDFQRSSTATETVTVQDNKPATPPPTYGTNSPPTARFDMPSYAETGEVVNVQDRSYDTDGNIVNRSWKISPTGSANASLGNTGGTITFLNPGIYTVTLTVTDDDGATDTYSQNISIGSPPPPPAPKSAPTAAFSMPSQAGQGVGVNIKNESYDYDGNIVDVSWEITPRDGVADILGFDGGTVTFLSPGTYTVTLTVTDNDGLSDSTSKTINITNEPPVAKINAPSEVVQGEDVLIASDSYDPDGTIAKTQWTVTPEVGMIGTLSGDKNTVYFDTEGAYTIQLHVEDRWGLSAEDTKTITVKPAIPKAYFEVLGTTKQNRKVILDATKSLSPSRYPILTDQNEWEIIPLTAGVTSSDVMIDQSSPKDKLEVLFKKPGDYKIRLRVHNSKHPSEWFEQMVKIDPDEPPVADFFVGSMHLRDPQNGNVAEIDLTDLSYSPDGDTISQRIWKYKFDSNNDGNFGDENWIIIDQGNNPTPSFTVNHVGKYLVELEVKEAFGQDTISQFVTDADYLRADTSNKPIDEKIFTVDNINPFVNFEVSAKKKADIIFTIGQTDSSKTQDLDSKIATYITSKLLANNVDVQISSISTRQMTAQDTFNWQIYDHYNYVEPYGSSLSQHIIVNSKSITMIGYTAPPFKDWMFMPDNNATQKTFTFDLSRDNTDWHSMEGGGFLFNASIVNNTLSGYAILYTQSGVKLVEINGVNVNSFHNGSYERVEDAGRLLATFPISNVYGNHNIKIVVDPNTVSMWDNGVQIINNYKLPDKMSSYGFGPITSYISHGCSQKSYFTFNNITMSTIVGKSLQDVLKEPSWRSEASHFLVNISDVPLDEIVFTANNIADDKTSAILTQLASKDIDFIALGTDANKDQYQKLIAANSGNGVFYYNNDMNAALDNVGNYILQKVQSAAKTNIQYVLLGEEVEYKTYYSDTESDPEYSRRWKYVHDPNYFENGMGQVSYNDQWLAQPVTVFDKVGKYFVTFQARDNPVGNDDRFDEYRKWSGMPQNGLEIYVHRKPIAQFAATLTPNGGNTSFNKLEGFEDDSNAFGITGSWHRSTAQKLSGSYSWTNNDIGDYATTQSQFTFNIPANATNARLSFDYLVRSEANYDYLNVYLDGQRIVHVSGNGSWQNFQTNLSAGNHTVVFEYTKDGSVSSYDDAGYIDNLQITYTANNLSGYNIVLTDYSYDLDHQSQPDKGIVQREWKWKEAGETTWHDGMPPSTLPVGHNYIIQLRVQDEDGPDGQGAWSDPAVQFITTKDINLAPVAQFVINPNPLPISKTLTIDDRSYDPNGDPIAQRLWTIEKNGVQVYSGSSCPTNFSSYGTGTYKITLKVLDSPTLYGSNALWSEPYSQVLTVIPDNQKPVANFTVTPNPVPADVNVSITDTSYDPDGDPIVAREWQIKRAGSTTWEALDGPPTSLESYGTGTHIIRLRVKDQPQLPQLDPLWSDWKEVSVTVTPGNQKPVARFTVTPNPVPADEPVTYNDTSYDPEGKPIATRVWTVKNLETGKIYQYTNQLPPTVFENTGWGINGDGVGTYEISLKVQDVSPNGLSPARWSDEVKQILVVEDPLRINGLVLTNIVNPPLGTVAPVIYPVSTPVRVKAGYRLTFKVDTNGGDKVDIKLYANGNPLVVHTDEGDTSVITKATVRKNASTTFSFWTDKDLPKGTVLDMKIVLTKTQNDGTTKSIVNNELGEHFAVIVGSAKEDSTINLTK